MDENANDIEHTPLPDVIPGQGLKRFTRTYSQDFKDEVVAERIGGATFHSLSKKHGIAIQTISSWYQTYLKNIPPTKSELARVEELMRLEGVFALLTETLRDPTLAHKDRIAALNAMIKCSESIRKLNGLDKPAQVEVTVSDAEKQFSERLREVSQRVYAVTDALREGSITEE